MRAAPIIACSLAVACGNEAKPTPTPEPTATNLVPTAVTSATAPVPTKPQPDPYVGPTGTVVGRVTITGDPPPKTSFKYTKGCEGAVATYGKLFRTGLEGGLADALVTVTNYGKNHVPPQRKAIPVKITNCAFSQRTISMTDGQHLEVQNLMNAQSFLPHLDGARQPATIAAVPAGDPIKLFSRGFSRYWLRDQMARPWMVAHVFHLPYSTATVTGLDGKFRLEGIPAGQTVKVSAMLPQLKNMNHVTKELKVEANEENSIDLELTFDAAKDTPADGHGGTKPKGVGPSGTSAAPEPSASPSAAPSASGSAAPRDPQ